MTNALSRQQDRILIPEHILHYIVSFLPFEYGYTLRLLSKHWFAMMKNYFVNFAGATVADGSSLFEKCQIQNFIKFLKKNASTLKIIRFPLSERYTIENLCELLGNAIRLNKLYINSFIGSNDSLQQINSNISTLYIVDPTFSVSKLRKFFPKLRAYQFEFRLPKALQEQIPTVRSIATGMSKKKADTVLCALSSILQRYGKRNLPLNILNVFGATVIDAVKAQLEYQYSFNEKVKLGILITKEMIIHKQERDLDLIKFYCCWATPSEMEFISLECIAKYNELDDDINGLSEDEKTNYSEIAESVFGTTFDPESFGPQSEFLTSTTEEMYQPFRFLDMLYDPTLVVKPKKRQKRNVIIKRKRRREEAERQRIEEEERQRKYIRTDY
jgi:hypothetical protein